MLRMGYTDKHTLLSLLVVGGEEDMYAREDPLSRENATRILRVYARRARYECSHHTLACVLPGLTLTEGGTARSLC